MIHTHDDSQNRLALTHNGLTLNNPADATDNTYEINQVAVMGQYDQNVESDPNDDGSEVGPVQRTLLILRIDGVIRSTTLAGLMDKRSALIAAFDPAEASYRNPTTDGVLPLDFSIPTLDTANYATGFIASRYYARARSAPIPPVSEFTGTACFFTIEMIIPDARRFFQTESTVSGSATATNTLAGTWSWPTVTITMAGAGHAAYSIARAHGTYGTKTLVLDLSGRSNGQVVVVNMKTKTITVGGVDLTGSIYVSGDYWRMDVGSNVLTVTNPTNATTVTGWRRAWVA